MACEDTGKQDTSPVASRTLPQIAFIEYGNASTALVMNAKVFCILTDRKDTYAPPFEAGTTLPGGGTYCPELWQSSEKPSTAPNTVFSTGLYYNFWLNLLLFLPETSFAGILMAWEPSKKAWGTSLIRRKMVRRSRWVCGPISAVDRQIHRPRPFPSHEIHESSGVWSTGLRIILSAGMRFKPGEISTLQTMWKKKKVAGLGPRH